MPSILSVFTKIADYLVFDLLKFSPESHWGGSLHFFVEDITKIYVLLVVMIYVIGFLRASLNVEKVRDFLQGKGKLLGYVMASGFGAVTPFCSCSSIPLFLGFTQARIPLGITMAFLITSPIINEVVVVLLASILGIKFLVTYILVGMGAGIIGGFFFDFIKGERWLQDFVKNIPAAPASCACEGGCNPTQSYQQKPSVEERHRFAVSELKGIFKRVWIWVLVGVGLGALLHGVVPDDFVANYLQGDRFWSVPAAVFLGIPLYANATGIVPVAESLLAKGLPIGTTLAFMMSTVAASFPEFMMLKQVMKVKLLVIFFAFLLAMFTMVGWILNLIF